MSAYLAAAETSEGAWVSGHVASHTRTLLHLNGRMEQPSGCFLSDQYSPEYLSRDGTLAAIRNL